MPEVFGGKISFGIGAFKVAVGNEVGDLRIEERGFHRGIKDHLTLQFHKTQRALVFGTAVNIVGEIPLKTGVIIAFGGKSRHFKEQTF